VKCIAFGVGVACHVINGVQRKMIIQKSSPSVKLGNFVIKYKQIPYDNRYFFIYYKGILMSKIPSQLIKNGDWMPFFPAAIVLEGAGNMKRFIKRVQAHNNYLDD